MERLFGSTSHAVCPNAPTQLFFAMTAARWPPLRGSDNRCLLSIVTGTHPHDVWSHAPANTDTKMFSHISRAGSDADVYLKCHTAMKLTGGEMLGHNCCSCACLE